MKIKTGQRVWIANRIIIEVHDLLSENRNDYYFQNTKKYLYDNCGLLFHFCHFKKGLKFKNHYYWRAEIIDVEKYMLAKINYGL
jgi:hypothetical protein